MKFSLEIPDEFLKEFDETIKGTYQTRTEAIREAMRILLNKLKEGKRLLEIIEEQRKEQEMHTIHKKKEAK